MCYTPQMKKYPPFKLDVEEADLPPSYGDDVIKRMVEQMNAEIDADIVKQIVAAANEVIDSRIKYKH